MKPRTPNPELVAGTARTKNTGGSAGRANVSSVPGSPERPGRIKDAYKLALVCIVLIAATLACYWPLAHYEFINFDDNIYVLQNQHVRGGFNWANVQWAFGSGVGGNWHPLTWFSHMLDCQLYGLNAGGHHLTNVLFHTANSLLLLLVLRRMTGSLWRSAFVASLFALHPMHVESVAWVAERKDVLSTFFFLLTLGAYNAYANCKVQSSKFKVQSSGKPSSEHATRITLHAPLVRPRSRLLRLRPHEQTHARDHAFRSPASRLLAPGTFPAVRNQKSIPIRNRDLADSKIKNQKSPHRKAAFFCSFRGLFCCHLSGPAT
jgi:hypothetical protein